MDRVTPYSRKKLKQGRKIKSIPLAEVFFTCSFSIGEDNSAKGEKVGKS
ncbi:MAG: hypothetical protein LBE38_06230 [Deltaproteobacteria bacterium]|jgi:hypothetical protein|nr:hypothetical protein [Deltaproteobacteria bacterium]